jgi:hypothetical protein
VDDARDRSAVEALCDAFVYAPLGFALEAPKLVPELAAKGRNQVAAARTVGRFVVSRAAGSLGPLAGSVLGGVLRGLSGARRSPEAPPVPEEPAVSPVLALEEVVVVPEADVAALEADALAEAAGALETGDSSTDGQAKNGHPPASKRRASRPRSSREGTLSSREGTRSSREGTRSSREGNGPAAPPDEAGAEPGDGLSGAPVEDDEVAEPDLDAARPVDDRAGSAIATVAAAGSETTPAPEPAAPATAAALAIPEYDSLAASQVVPRLSGLSHDELSAVRSYEAAHRGRRTILGRADQLLARSSGPQG